MNTIVQLIFVLFAPAFSLSMTGISLYHEMGQVARNFCLTIGQTNTQRTNRVICKIYTSHVTFQWR